MINDLVFVDDKGFHYPDYPTVLLSLKEQYRLIYGQDIDLEADTLDGQNLATLAQCYHDMAQTISITYNGFSPATATGDALSRQVRINGIARRAGTNSTVDLTIIGRSGTNIVNGVVEDLNGNKWNLPATVLIPPSGQVIVTAKAQTSGAISAIANTVTKISTPTLGWQSVNNVGAASIGKDTETDAELRIRQSQSVATASGSTVASVYGGVVAVAGVTRLKIYENDTALIDANGITRNSIAVVVEGGDATAIGAAIRKTKSGGCGTFGTTTIPITDEYGTINIKFSRPNEKAVKLKVTITPLAKYSNDVTLALQNALKDYVNSHDIGETLYFGQLMAVAYQTQSQYFETFNVTKIEVAVGAGAYVQSVDVTCAYNDAVITKLLSDIQVVVV
jgi:uncharacterized phage protein gp47/JayE